MCVCCHPVLRLAVSCVMRPSWEAGVCCQDAGQLCGGERQASRQATGAACAISQGSIAAGPHPARTSSLPWAAFLCACVPSRLLFAAVFTLQDPTDLTFLIHILNTVERVLPTAPRLDSQQQKVVACAHSTPVSRARAGAAAVLVVFRGCRRCCCGMRCPTLCCPTLRRCAAVLRCCCPQNVLFDLLELVRVQQVPKALEAASAALASLIVSYNLSPMPVYDRLLEWCVHVSL